MGCLTLVGSFVCRYRPLPADVYEEQSQQHPLIATRPEGVADHRVSGEPLPLWLVPTLGLCPPYLACTVLHCFGPPWCYERLPGKWLSLP